MAKKALVAVCCIVIAACLVVIAMIAHQYLGAESAVDEYRSAYVEEEEGADFPDVDWERLRKQNPDICGWVTVPKTKIDYPVCAAPKDDPDYYLHRDLDGNYSVAGVPYLDAACERDWTSPLSAVYGHHLISGRMFSPFANYSDESFFKKHRKIYLMTPEGNMLLTAVAANVVDANTERLKLGFKSADEAFAKEWRRLLKASEVVAKDAPDAPTQVFAFATCSYQAQNTRTIVFAVRSDETKPIP